MNQRKGNKTNHRLYTALKLCIAAGALFFIWDRVFYKENIGELREQIMLIVRDDYRLSVLLAVLLLMIVNWSLEAFKWKMMLNQLEKVSFLRSLVAVFTGLTVSFFTPNRVGEYAGRVMYLLPGNRVKGILLTVIENMAQLVITLVLGAFALPVFLTIYGGMPWYITLPSASVCILFALGIVVFFLRTAPAAARLSGLSFLKRFERYIIVAESATPAKMGSILLLSLARFLVFSGQLYLLLLVFDVQVGFPSAMLMIVLTFFVLTLVPTFAFADLGVRGAAGTFFFAYLTSHLAGVVYATLALWLINLVLPSAAGALLLAVVSPQRKSHELL